MEDCIVRQKDVPRAGNYCLLLYYANWKAKAPEASTEGNLKYIAVLISISR
jgi:hypothetical protein